MLFLATFTLHKTYSPGDDGMRREHPAPGVRLVEAGDAKEAEEILRGALEIDRPYSLLVELTDVEITAPLTAAGSH